MARAILPSLDEMGEATLERRARIRPSVTPPITSDGDFTKFAMCLEEFAYEDKVWRIQCGRIFHAQCWGRVARARGATVGRCSK
eukprot:8023266-Pyramimonas_sp.AAC.1